MAVVIWFGTGGTARPSKDCKGPLKWIISLINWFADVKVCFLAPFSGFSLVANIMLLSLFAGRKCSRKQRKQAVFVLSRGCSV